MSYNLFIDDIRNPDWDECVWSGVDASMEWVVARSSKEACDIVFHSRLVESWPKSS